MLDKQTADQGLNNTAMTSGTNSLIAGRSSETENKGKPQDINKFFAASFIFTVALGMF